MKHAAEMATDEINAAGGIAGRRLELVIRDDFGNPDSAVRVATALYQSDVVAVVGHSFSGATSAAAPVYNGGRNPLAHISPSASSPEISRLGPYTFRLCPSDLAHGAALAHWARETLGLSGAAVIYVNNGYGRGVRQTFVREFSRLGGHIVSVDPLGDPPVVGPYLERIARRNDVEFIVLAGYQVEAAALLRRAQELNLHLPVLGGDGLEQVYQLGPVAEGVYTTSAYLKDIDTDANHRFVAAYRQRFPDGAPPNQSAVGTYDALQLLKRVIEKAGDGRRAIRDELSRVGRNEPAFEGVTRRIAFDSNGDLADQQVFVGVVRGGAVRAAVGQ